MLRDIRAFVAGVVLFGLVFVIGCGAVLVLQLSQCGSESRPFLGSGKQAFAIYGCLLRDAGPLIAVKKALHIYNPNWRPVIK